MNSSSRCAEYKRDTLRIKHIAQHYYNPVLVAENERVAWIRHVVRTQSEVSFLNKLEEYLNERGNIFSSLDWWAFSKIDETLDEVYLPYYDPQSNRIRRFLPDFVFWLVKGNRYAIVFLDPKGMRQTEYQYKVDGYRELFWLNNAPRIFTHKTGLVTYLVSVHLLLYTKDANTAQEGYRKHWVDHPRDIPRCLDSEAASEMAISTLTANTEGRE